jgi:anti-sigma regulatory factor (Ser/Thr protein kinase)
MRSPRRLLTVAAAVLVVVCVLAAGLAALTILTIPLVIALELTVVAVMTGVVTHRRRGRRRGAADPAPDVEQQPASSELEWTAAWRVGPTHQAVPAVRERLSCVLSTWGLTGEAGEPTLLVVTELLDNAAEHGRGPARLAVELTGDGVRVAVTDGSPDAPRLRPRDLSASRGRGLQLVDGLSTRWGWTDEPPGKVVWAIVPTGWT